MEYLPGKCPNCSERRVSEVTERYESHVVHDGVNYDVVVPDLRLLKCEACGNRVLPPASDDRVSDAVRAAAGLLTPSEIVERRAKLNLSRDHVAGLLSIPVEVYGRWESGDQIQQRHSDLLLRSVFAVPELRSYLSLHSTVSTAHPQVA
jgi:DNA-binding transcriptional regulator YiaG